MRLAFLSPLPPAPTGVADYAAEILELLAPRHTIELFHDQEQVDATRLPEGLALHRAGRFLDRHAAQPYEAVVYQMGNGSAHDFLYPLLERVPGLLVLHDLVLHHARARSFLASPTAQAYAREPWSDARRQAVAAELGAYETEVARSHPAEARRLVEAQLGTVGDLLPYAYPLFRGPVESSRATAVHNRFMAEAIRAEVAGARVIEIPMPATATKLGVGDGQALRHRLGLPEDAFVVGCFGLLTREKRAATVARAVARVSTSRPEVRLLLVGRSPDPAALASELEALGVAERTVVTGHVPFETIPTHLEAADLVVQLRYPTARETSAALLRALAQGRPTVISDLENLAEVPDDAVLRADVTDEEGSVTRAILRLIDRPEARRRLGERAAAFVAAAHTPALAAAGYERALDASRIA